MSVKYPVTSLKFELTNQIKAVHSARDDVYIQVPDIKKEDMIPWSMEHTWFYPLCLDCESNQMTLLKILRRAMGVSTTIAAAISPTASQTMFCSADSSEATSIPMKSHFEVKFRPRP